MEQQIAAAVQAALTPNPSQQEAYRYLEDVKNNSQTTWSTCLEIFLAGASSSSSASSSWKYTHAPEARMFGLQVVDDVLTNHFSTIDPSSIVAVQNGLVEYLKREYVNGDAEGQLYYLRNKVVHTLFLLFMQTYTSTWPDFFQTFFQLLSASSTESPADTFNTKSTDLFLRLLHEVSTEISDNTLRLNKAHARLLRDTELRDAVRAKDAPGIADQVIKILAFSLGRIEQPTSQLSSQHAVELSEMALRVLADLAPWIDISLLVTPTLLPLLFQSLFIPHMPVRLAAADLVYEVVSKGMSPSDKLELLRVLNVGDVVVQLLESDGLSRSQQTNGATSNDESRELFREKLARVTTALGLELTKIVDEASATDDQKMTALSAALALRPTVLRFLEDEYDDTSATVIPYIQSIMSIYKKEKKRNAQGHLTEEKASFLTRLLETTISKMRFSSEEEWGADEDDEDGEDEAVIAFAEMRKNLKTLFDAVAWIDFDLFSSIVKNLVQSTFDTVDNGGQGLSWNDVEVALYVLYIYGEPAAKSLGTTNVAAFVRVPAEEVKKVKTTPDHNINYDAYPPSVLGELMLRAIQSKVSSFPHPSIPLQLFECIARYHDFFVLAPHTLTTVLPIFLDERGMHQSRQSIRSRCFYLFNRFIQTARTQLAPHITPDTVTGICTKVEDLLVIDVEVPTPEAPGEDVLAKAANRGSPFDSQLYLFEALGTTISLLSSHPSEQVGILRALLEPLLRDIQIASAAPASNLASLLRLHHLIKAVGNIAYGFPEVRAGSASPTAEWVTVLRNALGMILDSLKAKSEVAIIREASLGSFKAIASRTGETALPLVAPLIDCLVDNMQASELIEFLSFIGMLVHRYKAAFVDMLDLLIAPVFDRVYYFLEQPLTGTDDIQQHSELCRAYFSLLLSISSAAMQDVLISSRNAPRLENLLNSIPHYMSTNALLTDQKGGLTVINRLTPTWIKAVNSTDVSALPQFKDFVYQRMVPLAMELPVRQAFDYSDAQAYQVIGEIATLLKALHLLRGDEFLNYLKSPVFTSFGLPEDVSQSFLSNLAQSSDGKVFKKWLAPFFQRAKQTSNDKPYSVAHLLNVVPSAAP